MIISLRGTNGSGKSTLVRAIMDLCGTRTTIAYPDPRSRRPMGIVCSVGRERGLFVPGHYDIANGGMDTLPSLDLAYELIRAHDALGLDVLCEGKNMTDSGARLLGCWMLGADARAVLIDHPLAECVRSVRERGHRIAESSIRRLHDKSGREFDRLSAAGLTTLRGSREECLAGVRRWLEI